MEKRRIKRHDEPMISVHARWRFVKGKYEFVAYFIEAKHVFDTGDVTTTNDIIYLR